MTDVYDPLFDPIGAERYLRQQAGLNRGRQPSDPNRPRHCPDCGTEVHAGYEVTVKAFKKGEYRCKPCRAEKRKEYIRERNRRLADGTYRDEHAKPLKYSAAAIEASITPLGKKYKRDFACT